MKLWTQVNLWIDGWIKSPVIQEDVPDSLTNPLMKTILEYLENDITNRDAMVLRIKKLQWWAKSIQSEEGLADIGTVARQYIWDSFFKGREQIALIEQNAVHVDEAGDEQYMMAGSVKAVRYLDTATRTPVYIGSDGAPCPPSILELFTSSKDDEVIKARANQKVTAEIYGFMVPWENTIMFKTNEPKPEGKDPAGGAACSIVSNVKGHRMKLIRLGEILKRYTGKDFDLTEVALTTSRKLQGAPNFCALMEIVMRWMDLRKEKYGGLRYFYRPLSAYYSKHRSKK